MISKRLLDMLNDLQPRQLLMLAGGVAVLIFIVIYLGLSSLSQPEPAPTATEPIVEMRSVVVVKQDLAPRTLLQEGMLQIRELPADSVPGNAITNLQSAIGRSVSSTIYAGDILTSQKLLSGHDAGFIGSIPEECRAVSVNVSDVTGVAGFAKPGDYVDVALVEKSAESATSRILLQNVLLLSINKDMGIPGAEESAADRKTKPIDNPTIATMALRPEEALELMSASKLGEIYLMLRPSEPTDMYADQVNFTVNSSYPPKEPPQQAPAIAPPAPVVQPPSAPVAPEKPSDSGYEVILGDQIQQNQPQQNQIQQK
ncbi:MAG: Flp pilus assembly protein CpaB [Selenomonadaceae bacterium]|nr:Flp pilus assembly protein CpaB [Selenomonadaceae bacterium]